MEVTLYHVFTRSGYDRTVKTQPDHKIGEYVVGVRVVVPSEVFQRRPIPVVDVKLAAPDWGTPDVIVDGVKVPTPADEVARKQAVALEQLANLYAFARKSSDPDMQQVAKQALDSLLAAGVEVAINTEDAEAEGEENS